MNIFCETDFNLPLMSFYSVLDELYNLDDSTAIGHGDLPISYVKKVAEQIYQPLSFIFLIYTSLLTGKVPEAIKVAKVTPIFKSWGSELVSKYNSISVFKS